MASFAAIHARLSSVFVSAAAPAGAGACFSMFKRGGFLRPPLNSAYSIVQENLYFSSTFSLILPCFSGFQGMAQPSLSSPVLSSVSFCQDPPPCLYLSALFCFSVSAIQFIKVLSGTQLKSAGGYCIIPRIYYANTDTATDIIKECVHF